MRGTGVLLRSDRLVGPTCDRIVQQTLASDHRHSAHTGAVDQRVPPSIVSTLALMPVECGLSEKVSGQALVGDLRDRVQPEDSS